MASDMLTTARSDMNPALCRGPDTLPSSAEAERALLRAMLGSADILDDCLAMLSAEDFYQPSCRTVFETASALRTRGRVVDALSIADSLRAAGKLERVGGEQGVLDLYAEPLARLSWRESLRIVKRDSVRRDLIVAAATITANSLDAPEDLSELVGEAERAILSATERGVRADGRSLGDMMASYYDRLTELSEGGGPVGVRTGCDGLDALTLGLRPGQMTVVGARPGVGKTAWATSVALNAAEDGASVVIFSLEMSEQEVSERLVSARSLVSLEKLRSGRLDSRDWCQVSDAIQELQRLDVTVDDAAETTVSEVAAKARRYLRGKDRGLVVVDYLQLMSPTSATRRVENRATQVAEMSRGLKIMAKDLGVPVVALSQLNRGLEGRANRRPQLSDLRESGSIEQDADIVVLMDRSFSQEEAARGDRPDEGITELVVAKNRSGALGTVRMRFEAPTLTFSPA